VIYSQVTTAIALAKYTDSVTRSGAVESNLRPAANGTGSATAKYLYAQSCNDLGRHPLERGRHDVVS
jgi:hypothetical protein